MTHPKISLRQIIIKRNSKIVQEPQYGPLLLGESIKQITSRALFGSPWCSLLGRWGRGIGLVAFSQDLIIATKEVCEHQQIQFVLAQRFGSLNLGFHREQQLFHLACPKLLEFFFE
jgi:hypothetical protein